MGGMSSFHFRLACAVPAYEQAEALATGIRLFDEQAFVHIKEAQEDDFWELVALFNLAGGQGALGRIQFSMISSLFVNSVAEVGGRKL